MSTVCVLAAFVRGANLVFEVLGMKSRLCNSITSFQNDLTSLPIMQSGFGDKMINQLKFDLINWSDFTVAIHFSQSHLSLRLTSGSRPENGLEIGNGTGAADLGAVICFTCKL